MRQKDFRRRGMMLSGFTLLVMLAFVLSLYDNQMLHGIDIDRSAAVNTITTVEPVEAARGLLTDRNGTPLVRNETVYHVVLDLDAMGEPERQRETVELLIDLCRREELEHNTGGLPIRWGENGAEYTTDHPFDAVGEDGAAVPTRFARLCESMEWPADAENPRRTAAAMLDYFGLADDEQGREALDVLYACLLREREILWTTWYFAEEVDMGFVTAVKEQRLSGVEIRTAAKRVYVSQGAAHLLGQTGAISAENWEDGEGYKARGYAMDAVVGVSGAEYAFEEYLRGVSGTARRITSLDGTLLSRDYEQRPEAGSSVRLTIDLPLQQAAEQALAEHTAAINGGEGGSAVVVMDVRDGGILAAASWPTFDLASYREDYESLAQDPLKPLFNRAFLGTYAPGSTYKMVTATAALDTGAISPRDTVTCNGWMDYLDTRFRCWIYRTKGGRHGQETVSDAIRDSCNIFFYTMGSQVGIDTLNEYARGYGLGVPTGVELSEATGVNAGPEYSHRLGQTWYPGNTLSAAIGQSDNQFTPLQICGYLSTLVNGGTRYQAHLMQAVTTYDGAEVLETFRPAVLDTVPLSEENRQAILRGMAQAVDATAGVRQAFAPLAQAGIAVEAKTGSAQVSGQENANGLFVCFAPLDDPQIAVCVAVEKGGAGADTAVIAADVVSTWFGIEKTEEQ